MFLSIFVRNVNIKMVIGIFCHTGGGGFYLNSSPFSITLNLLLVAKASDSEYSSVGGVTPWSIWWGRWLSFPFSSWTFFFPSVSFNFLRCRVWGCSISSYPCLFLLFEYFLLWRKFCILFYLKPFQLPLHVSLQLYHFLSALSHYLKLPRGV